MLNIQKYRMSDKIRFESLKTISSIIFEIKSNVKERQSTLGIEEEIKVPLNVKVILKVF
jgi:hypothetical protein